MLASTYTQMALSQPKGHQQELLTVHAAGGGPHFNFMEGKDHAWAAVDGKQPLHGKQPKPHKT